MHRRQASLFSDLLLNSLRSDFSNIGSEGSDGNGGSFLSTLSSDMGMESLRGDAAVVLDTEGLLGPALAAAGDNDPLVVTVLVFSFLRFKYSCRLTCTNINIYLCKIE